MCGRFAQALPPRDYVDVVDEQVNKRRGGGGGRPSWRRGDEEAETSSQRRGKNRKGASQEAVDDIGSMEIISRVEENDYHPTHNVAPGVRVPIVRMQNPKPMTGYGDKEEGTFAESTNTKQCMFVQAMRWGLLPHYTTSIPRGADAMRTINARDDAVLSGRSMWTPILRAGKRCVVFCQGFYEWQKKDDGAQRIAHFVGMKDLGHGRTDVKGERRALMPMAGLWERCSIEGEEIYSFTIITTDSNEQLNFLHDRMPVILPDHEAIQIWLGIKAASNEQICGLLKPYDAGKLDCYTVPRDVGRVGTDDRSFILPVASRKDGIAAAFGRVQKTQSANSPSKKEKGGGQQSATPANSESNAPAGEEIKSLDESAQKLQKDRSESIEEQDERLARQMQEEEDQIQQGQRGSKRKERSGSIEERDAALALKLQDEEGSRSMKLPKKEANLAEKPIIDAKEERRGSSKFSPEPFNPPVSPTRPSGGYSTTTNPDPAPYKRTMHKDKHFEGGRGHGGNAVKQKQLQEAAKGTKDIRSFF